MGAIAGASSFRVPPYSQLPLTMEHTTCVSWRAECNDGLPIEIVSNELAAYKSKANFQVDFLALQILFQVRQHPTACLSATRIHTRKIIAPAGETGQVCTTHRL
mmetsp:Transcript_3985/g.12052  ORF Transcript_3985/g.12052 Transcript_3985/m.12052 type:complete len:104 (+) Transcript_3985:643-954(+)